MSDIYMMPVDSEVTTEQYEQLHALVSEYKKSDVQKYMYRLDAVRSLTGEAMVRFIISWKYNMENCKINFGENTYGKPFVKGIPCFHFNISHAGKWVVCAIDKRPIGIDIEKIAKIDLQIANRFFSEIEANDLYSQPCSEQTNFFYKLWTLKESYIKMVGKSLHIPLDSFSCRIKPDNNVAFVTDDRSSDVHLKLYEPDSRYKMAICQTNEMFPLNIHYLTIDEILLSDKG